MEDLVIKNPATICLTGKKFSGKSTFIQHFLIRHQDEFASIILISQSAKVTGEFDNLVIEPKKTDKKFMIVSQISEVEMEHILDISKKHGRQSPPILLIFDDIIGMKGMSLRASTFKELVTTGRQYNISLIFSSQKFRVIPDFLRVNCEYGIFLNMPVNEINKIYDEFAPRRTRKRQFVDVYQSIVKQIGFGLLYDLRKQAWFLIHIQPPTDINELDEIEDAPPPIVNPEEDVEVNEAVTTDSLDRVEKDESIDIENLVVPIHGDSPIIVMTRLFDKNITKPKALAKGKSFAKVFEEFTERHQLLPPNKVSILCLEHFLKNAVIHEKS